MHYLSHSALYSPTSLVVFGAPPLPPCKRDSKRGNRSATSRLWAVMEHGSKVPGGLRLVWWVGQGHGRRQNFRHAGVSLLWASLRARAGGVPRSLPQLGAPGLLAAPDKSWRVVAGWYRRAGIAGRACCQDIDKGYHRTKGVLCPTRPCAPNQHSIPADFEAEALVGA